MNGTTEISNKLYLLKTGGTSNSNNASTRAEALGPPRISPDAHLQLQQIASSVKSKAAERDQISISEQAKERLRLEDVIKLETPPHITTVKEHVQELVRRTLRPAYESREEASDAPIQASHGQAEAEAVLPVQKSAEKASVEGVEAEALPVEKQDASAGPGTQPESPASTSQARPELTGVAHDTQTADTKPQNSTHNLVV